MTPQHPPKGGFQKGEPFCGVKGQSPFMADNAQNTDAEI
jgi:hypothetical protein